jgi:hypothetical protein
VAGKKLREKKPKRKNDPKLVAAARELKDRWLEHVNTVGEDLLGCGKYDVTRALPDVTRALPEATSCLVLPHAA